MQNPDHTSQCFTAELDTLRQRVARLENEATSYQDRVRFLEGQHYCLFEGTGDAVFMIDPATLAILDVNANAARRLGYTKEVLLQLTLNDIDVTGSDSATIDTRSASVASVGERRYRTKDGTLLPVEVRSHISRVDGREIRVNFVRDVTALKQTQEALQVRESANQQFHEKLKILNEISIDLDQAASFDDLCRLAIELGHKRLGFDRLGLWFLDDTHEFMVGSFGIDEQGQIRDERDQRFRVDASSMLIGITDRKIEVAIQDNARLLDDRGQVVGLGWSAAAALWDGNAVIGYINTDNFLNREPPKEYEVELLRLYGATVGYLAKSKRAEQQVRKLSRAIDQSSSIVMITDSTGQIEYVNPQFTLVTGYATDEVMGKNPRFLKSGDTSQEEYGQLWQTILSGDEWRGELRNRRKDGEYYWALASISPVKNPEGIITDFVAVQEDITELKKAQQQRLDLAIEREKVQILANFIADVAHEFKTPLSIINTGIYLLELSTESQNSLESLKTIKEQASDINLLLDAMLTMARLDDTQAETLSPLNLNDLVREAITCTGTLVTQKKLRLLTSLDDLPQIEGNSENLFRAITEVLQNAIQYTFETGEITVQTGVLGDTIFLEIGDSGAGICADDLPHIFDRFYRVDKARTTRGSGLGLSIAKKVVETHGGRIDVESAVGAGSTFRIILPQESD